MIKIARIVKSNGTDGELVMSFQGIDADQLKLEEPIFIIFDGIPVPFFVLSMTPRGSKVLVRLNDINNLKDAEEVVGQDVYIEESSIEDYEDDELSLENLAGWMVQDEEGKEIGEISDYEDIPGNPCLYINTAQGQKMIPLHEDFIISIDQEHTTLIMNLPEGLI